ncbi:MAG: DUF6345 domain-containing protein [Fibrobacterota bacterium]|nr:DUF6345 domain-containing protein [Fibrobacterota bacterium]
MLKKILGSVSLCLLAAGPVSSFPISMDIGTFAIDDYGSTGGGVFNLSFMIAGGQNFFTTANANIPGYSSAVAAAGMGSSNPSLALDLRNTQVTKSAITNTSSSYGSRGYCDFVYYGGHGFNSSLFLGLNAGFGQVSPAELNIGAGYNRWLLTNSCSLFNGGAPATTWQPAFQGLKAMLGFKSFIFDNNVTWDLYNEFWVNWTYREKSLLNSFFDAQINYGYKHLYPSKGLEPGCLSALVPAFQADYCREAFRNVAHNYNAASANTGYYYSKIIGTPQY